MQVVCVSSTGCDMVQLNFTVFVVSGLWLQTISGQIF